SRVASSSGSVAARTLRRIAASRTVRVSGPAVSWVWVIGMTPARLMSPTVGFTVTTPFWVAGERSEPDVSVPIATAVSPAATAPPRLPRRHPRAPRARARPAGLHDRNASGVELDRKGVFDLAAERRIARRHVDRQDIGKLGEVRFPEDHGAGLAQELRHRRV